MIENPDVMRELLCTIYKKLYNETYRSIFFGAKFIPLDENKTSPLQVLLWRMKLDGKLLIVRETPGPNGISSAFFRDSCDVIKQDTVALFKDFHCTDKLMRSLTPI